MAAGAAPWAIGTDTGGSIRQPAALCGIVGLKPTYGAVSRYGMIAFASSLDQAGPVHARRHRRRAAVRRDGGRGPVRLDLARLPRAGRPADARPTCAASASACPRSSPARASSPACSPPSARRLDLARDLGAEIVDITLPHAPHALAAYYLIAPAEASANLARYDGVRYGLREPADDLLTMYTRTRAQGFGAEVKRRIMLGTYALSSGYYDAYYGRAQKVRTKIAEDFHAAWETSTS